MIRGFINNIKGNFTIPFWHRQYKNEVTSIEAKQMMRLNRDILLLDVRSVQEHDEGNINGSIVIPLYELYSKAESILNDKNQTIIVYCKNGGRSARAVNILEELGYMSVFSIEGGIEEW